MTELEEPITYCECLRCGHIGDTSLVKARIKLIGGDVIENVSKIIKTDEDDSIPLDELTEHKPPEENWKVIDWDSFCPECGWEGYFLTEKEPGDLAWVDGGEMS